LFGLSAGASSISAIIGGGLYYMPLTVLFTARHGFDRGHRRVAQRIDHQDDLVTPQSPKSRRPRTYRQVMRRWPPHAGCQRLPYPSSLWKPLEYLLVLAAEPFQCTHDLDDLAALLPPVYPRFARQAELDFPQFTRRGTESPRIDLANEPEFPRFRCLAGTRINPVVSKAHA
jgi:hypothetical protein